MTDLCVNINPKTLQDITTISKHKPHRGGKVINSQYILYTLGQDKRAQPTVKITTYLHLIGTANVLCNVYTFIISLYMLNCFCRFSSSGSNSPIIWVQQYGSGCHDNLLKYNMSNVLKILGPGLKTSGMPSGHMHLVSGQVRLSLKKRGEQMKREDYHCNDIGQFLKLSKNIYFSHFGSSSQFECYYL